MHQQEGRSRSRPPSTTGETSAMPSASSMGQDMDEGSFFDCNICHDTPVNAVVTLCGHLYCWECIYRWMELRSTSQSCPVCKAGIASKDCIPIYGRGSNNRDPRTNSHQSGPHSHINGADSGTTPIPDRPVGRRPPPVRQQDQGFMRSLRGVQGLYPTLLDLGSNRGLGLDPLTARQRHEAMLARMLLVLGSFVIMCLILY